MQKPVILIADHDAAVLDAVQEAVEDRYGHDYRVVRAPSPDAVLRNCRELREQGVAVALLMAADGLGTAGGAAVLAEARAIHPLAGRMLLTAHADTEAAILAINETGVHRYVVQPADHVEDGLYPATDELLGAWQERAALPYLVVETIMDTDGGVVTIAHEASLHDAAQVVAATRVGDLMVVDGTGRFLGVLSEGDILRNALPDLDEIVAAGATLHDAYQLFVRKARELSHRPIMPLVIRDPIVMAPDDHVARAATILIERQIRRLPVVDGQRLVGTVSRANICQALVGAP